MQGEPMLGLSWYGLLLPPRGAGTRGMAPGSRAGMRGMAPGFRAGTRGMAPGSCRRGWACVRQMAPYGDGPWLLSQGLGPRRVGGSVRGWPLALGEGGRHAGYGQHVTGGP